jgi:hypothetical protein
MTIFRCEIAVLLLLTSCDAVLHRPRNEIERIVQNGTPSALRGYLRTRIRDPRLQSDLTSAGFLQRPDIESDGCRYFDYDDPFDRGNDAYVRFCSNGTWFADVGQPFDDGNLRI